MATARRVRHIGHSEHAILPERSPTFWDSRRYQDGRMLARGSLYAVATAVCGWVRVGPW